MSVGIIGKKLGMSQVFDGRELIPVTVIQAGPCKVVQKKTVAKDGYEAVQLAFQEEKKQGRITKAAAGHFKKSETAPHRFLREFRMAGYEQGQDVKVDIFKKGELIAVSGVSKGKGFAGVMKRHNFAGGPGGHGSMFNRAPGSIGASAYPSRVWPGKKLPGHMGSATVTVKNLKIIEVRPDQNLLFVRGAVPGGDNALVLITKG
ncbi:MAG: 50S ribosomal protein L3 [Nitrospirae bacterium]|jgi:large subunit ribosomal protein L3|nr:50S ribosomal protein L3 [Nitrospirota bacterium]NTW66653.1 50S ribosomal protein L3 [Nitrospirota bacterium]